MTGMVFDLNIEFGTSAERYTKIISKPPKKIKNIIKDIHIFSRAEYIITKSIML